MKWIYVAVATATFAGPAQSFTCKDVRALSQDQRAYYIRVYNITPAQQDRIRRECSKGSAETVSAPVGRRERDARASQQ
jgi:hypothetical protein